MSEFKPTHEMNNPLKGKWFPVRDKCSTDNEGYRLFEDDEGVVVTCYPGWVVREFPSPEPAAPEFEPTHEMYDPLRLCWFPVKDTGPDANGRTVFRNATGASYVELDQWVVRDLPRPKPAAPVDRAGQCAERVQTPEYSTAGADSAERKGAPLYSGVLAYFPDALVDVSRLSKSGNDKHNPGQSIRWSKHKSVDHADCIARHLVDLGTIDPEDGVRHATKVAWRALANLQMELEAERAGVSVQAYVQSLVDAAKETAP